MRVLAAVTTGVVFGLGGERRGGGRVEVRAMREVVVRKATGIDPNRSLRPE